MCGDRSLLCSKSRNGELGPEVGQAITTSGSHASHPKGSIHNLPEHHQLGSKCSSTQVIFTPKLKLCPADIFCLSSHHLQSPEPLLGQSVGPQGGRFLQESRLHRGGPLFPEKKQRACLWNSMRSHLSEKLPNEN